MMVGSRAPLSEHEGRLLDRVSSMQERGSKLHGYARDVKPLPCRERHFGDVRFPPNPTSVSAEPQ